MKKCDVCIVGLGPIGAITSLALAKEGLHVIVIEKEKEVYPLPRAIAVDNEILRVLSSLGIQINNKHDFVPSFTYEFLNENNQLLFGINRSTRDEIDAYSMTALFRQPEFEQRLREIIFSNPLITVHLNEELIELQQNSNHVTAITTNYQIEAKYLLGCDGARSKVRKLLDIPLKELMQYEEPWLIVDATIEEGVHTEETMQQLCNPKRAISYIPRKGTNNRRWEIQIKDDDPKELHESKTFIDDIISPWVAPSNYKIERTAIYTFRALEAEDWYKNRVFLLGDAAHMMPPFLGQGLSSGVRDAINLSWKLGGVLQNKLHPSIFTTYELERKEHVRLITFIAILLGKILMLKGTTNVALRNSTMQLLHRLPITKDKIDQLYFDIPKMQNYVWSSKNGNQFDGLRIKNAEVCYDNQIVLLDQLINNHFSIITFGKDVPTIKKDWSSFNTIHVHIYPKKYRKHKDSCNVIFVEDLSGIYETYFNEKNVSGFIVRPDKYILGSIKQEAKIYNCLLKGQHYADPSTLKSPNYGTLLKHIIKEEKIELQKPIVSLASLTFVGLLSTYLIRKRGS